MCGVAVAHLSYFRRHLPTNIGCRIQGLVIKYIFFLLNHGRIDYSFAIWSLTVPQATDTVHKIIHSITDNTLQYT